MKIFVVNEKTAYTYMTTLMADLDLEEEPQIWDEGESVTINGNKITAVELDNSFRNEHKRKLLGKRANGLITLWQVCPECGKKRVYYRYKPYPVGELFWCTNCKKSFSKYEYQGLIRQPYGKVNENKEGK